MDSATKEKKVKHGRKAGTVLLWPIPMPVCERA